MSEETAGKRKVNNLPAYLGFLGGVLVAVLGQLAPAWINSDVRNQVYEATYQSKQQTLKVQQDLLALQESYLKKLGELQELRDSLRQGQLELDENQRLLEEQKESARAAIANLRRRYSRFEKQERQRLEKSKEWAAIKARIAPYNDHFCVVDHLLSRNGDGICDRGYRATFARDTPDAKVVVPGRGAECGNYDGFEASRRAEQRAEQRCEVYARSFFAKKGLGSKEIDALMRSWTSRRLNDLLSSGGGVDRIP